MHGPGRRARDSEEMRAREAGGRPARGTVNTRSNLFIYYLLVLSGARSGGQACAPCQTPGAAARRRERALGLFR